jgi:hypothetical protein
MRKGKPDVSQKIRTLSKGDVLYIEGVDTPLVVVDGLVTVLPEKQEAQACENNKCTCGRNE